MVLGVNQGGYREGSLFGYLINFFVSWDVFMVRHPAEDDEDRRTVKSG